jgi:uncharacterized membrane protein YoaK (UPF0700 family)
MMGPWRCLLAEDSDVWPSAVTHTLALGGLLLLVFTAGWEVSHGRPDHVLQIVLVSIVAVVMGIQSGAVRRLGPFSTTYLTGTLTSLLEAVADRSWSVDESRGLAIIVAAIGGAALATLVIDNAATYLPLVLLVPLTIVLVGSMAIGCRPLT